MAQVRITLPPSLDRKVEDLQSDEKELNGGKQKRTKAEQCTRLVQLGLDALIY